MDVYKVIVYSKPDKSDFLMLFLKTLKDRIVLYDSGIEFQSFCAVNLHDFRPFTEQLITSSIYNCPLTGEKSMGHECQRAFIFVSTVLHT